MTPAGAMSDLKAGATGSPFALAPAGFGQIVVVPRPLTVMVSGPYRADTARQRQRNLDRLNRVALRVHRAGHVPLVGVSIALNFLSYAEHGPDNAEIMAVSMALIPRCDAVLLVAHSPGADREVAAFRALGKPVLSTLEQLPQV